MALPPPAPAADPKPYRGAFGRAEAYHLLRRTTYAVTPARVDEAVALGLEATLDRLLDAPDELPAPVNASEPGDPHVGIGATWIDAPLSETRELNGYRTNSLHAWIVRSAYRGDFSLRAKQMMFWHNHFACTQDGDARGYYDYFALLRRSAFGDFRRLIRDITLDVTMLMFLDGAVNDAYSPNENYARELLELYTLGKGPQAGEGDYTTYTEDDVRALARALTGWKVRYRGSTRWGQRPESYFVARDHDDDAKQLSPRMSSVTIPGGGGAGEVDLVVDAIFRQPAVARHLVRKLYRWYVHYDVTDAVEREVVEPLARLFERSEFHVAPVLRQLLGSEHFFALERRGAIVKNPLDYAIDLTAGLEYAPPADPLDEEFFMKRIASLAEDQDMLLWEPPQVAGFTPFYQAPLYNRAWITAQSLAVRGTQVETFTGGGYYHNDTVFRADLLAFFGRFPDATDPDALVRRLAERVLPRPLSDAQLAALKDILIPGLPDFEWTVEYGAYLADPGDPEVAQSVERKLRDLTRAVFAVAEAHLS